MVPASVTVGRSQGDLCRSDRAGEDLSSDSSTLNLLLDPGPARPGPEPEFHAQQQPGLDARPDGPTEIHAHQHTDAPRMDDPQVTERDRSAQCGPGAVAV